jgi:hypothetical protein
MMMTRYERVDVPPGPSCSVSSARLIRLQRHASVWNSGAYGGATDVWTKSECHARCVLRCVRDAAVSSLG